MTLKQYLSREKIESEKKITQRVLSMIDCNTRFALYTDNYKVVEALNKMKNNHGSDIEYNKML